MKRDMDPELLLKLGSLPMRCGGTVLIKGDTDGLQVDITASIRLTTTWR